MKTNDKTLAYLSELPDYKVASDDCDVRGWEVHDKNNRKVGTVDGLLVNKSAERVVYLDVEVDKRLIEEDRASGLAAPDKGVYEFTHKDGDNHLIIPVGMVQLDEDKKTVRANELDYKTFAAARRFPKGAAIERDYEIMMMRHYQGFPGANHASDSNETFYSGSEFENRLRRNQGGRNL